jgi:hypothetical protein
MRDPRIFDPAAGCQRNSTWRSKPVAVNPVGGDWAVATAIAEKANRIKRVSLFMECFLFAPINSPLENPE